MTAIPFVLVPGAGGAAWFWHLVAAELTARGHLAIPVELPADDERAGLEDYVDVVVAAGSGHGDLVVVAQSLGGFSAVPACLRLPVRALVFVNAMIPAPGETAGEWWDNTGQRAARVAKDEADGRDPDAPFDEQAMFFHDVAPEVVAAGAAHAKQQSETVFRSPSVFTDWPAVPTHVIASRDDRLFPLEFQRRVARERLGVEPIELPGGHLVALSHPVELTDRLIECCR